MLLTDDGVSGLWDLSKPQIDGCTTENVQVLVDKAPRLVPLSIVKSMVGQYQVLVGTSSRYQSIAVKSIAAKDTPQKVQPFGPLSIVIPKPFKLD
ncbi:hypothetical protein TWF481_008892 [Arthrobotrys musiformis]|uniref:Uncharacterized protein n=1 Tax=Arthrobotrys musiformis TaxID=47236 RepID=A0AAV9W8J5_9PEZI